MKLSAANAFDGCDLRLRERAHRRDARTNRFAVSVYGTGSAQRGPTAEFGSCQPEYVAQIPKQRHIRVTLKRLAFAIDLQLNHRFTSANNDCRRRTRHRRNCRTKSAYAV